MQAEVQNPIRLNSRGVDYLMKCGGKHPGGNKAEAIDWKHRIGKVVRVSRDRKLAYIIWEGNKAISDPLPVSFIERLK